MNKFYVNISQVKILDSRSCRWAGSSCPVHRPTILIQLELDLEFAYDYPFSLDADYYRVYR